MVTVDDRRLTIIAFMDIQNYTIKHTCDESILYIFSSNGRTVYNARENSW